MLLRSANGKQFQIPPHEWGLVVIFHNYLKNLQTNWDSSELQKAIQLKIQDDVNCDILINKLPDFQKEMFHSIMSGTSTPEVKKLAQTILKNEQESFKHLSPKYWAEELALATTLILSITLPTILPTDISSSGRE